MKNVFLALALGLCAVACKSTETTSAVADPNAPTAPKAECSESKTECTADKAGCEKVCPMSGAKVEG